MRLAISFPGVHRKAGVERVAAECTRFLAMRGHHVDVFANEWEEENSALVKYRFVPVRKKPGFLKAASYFKNVRTMLKASDYDGIGTFGSECPFGGVYWAQSVHRAWIEYSKSFRKPWSLGRWKQRLNPLHRVLLRQEALHFRGRNYRKVIALTKDVKADLMKFYDVPADDIVVLPNGFAPSEFNRERSRSLRAEMRQKLGYSDGDKVIVFAANELERKGFGPLMRAMASLGDASLRLLVVGRVTPDSYVDEMRRLGVSDRVQFTGPTRDVATYYAAADLFALPTQYEAWGLVIIEAMATGLPVLTSRLAGASIAVREGETGLLLDHPADEAEIAAKLKQIIAGEHVDAETIGQSVAPYAWDQLLLKYESLMTGSSVTELADQSLAAANPDAATTNAGSSGHVARATGAGTDSAATGGAGRTRVRMSLITEK